MSGPLRLVQVTGSSEWAGGERHLLDLIAGLDPARFEVKVVCPEPGPLVQRLRGLGVETEVVELFPLGSLKPIGKLAARLQAWRAALVQSHGARSNFYARLACRRLGLPHVATVHNSISDYPVPAWRRWLYIAADRAFAPSSKAVVCVSESLKRDLLRQGGDPSRLRVIPNGVDLKAFDPGHVDSSRLRAEWTSGSPGQPRLIGLAGRMTEQKGHRTLIDALPALISAFPGLRVVFIGDGPLRPELEALAARPGLEGRVLFAGVREDMPVVLAALDLVVLPSLSEGLPYVLLEALAMERPVVASAVNGVVEVVPRDGQGARLVQPRDPAGLAAAVSDLLSDPARAKEQAAQGRARVLEFYSRDAMVDRWQKLYDEVLR